MEENSIGTVPFTLKFWKLQIFINIVFALIGTIIGYVAFPRLLMEPAMGLWPILMCDLVIQCYQQPEMPRNLCCLPIEIKSKYYPLVLIGLFMIFFGPQFSLITGLAVGYLYVFGYLEFLKTSPQSIRIWSEKFPFKKYKEDPSFRVSSSAL